MTYGHIYMVGIGGIGMSALAQLYAARGEVVSGSDRNHSPTTMLLEKKGIQVHAAHDALQVPEALDLLVYSDAVPADNPERAVARERGVRELSYFEALGEATKGCFTIAVAGSHGKTTATAMLAKILYDAGKEPSDAGKEPTAIVGSLVKDFGSNVLVGSAHGPFVVEACEYNDHLLKLSPQILAITNLEWDHTDYFKDFDSLKKTFRQAIFSLPKDGTLIVNLEDETLRELADTAACAVVDYAPIATPKLKLLGAFNEMNAKVAIAAARAFDPSIPNTTLYGSVRDFRGTWRRFEYKGRAPGGAEVYDDYAHHPTEIKTTLSAVREKFPDKKIIVAFHPHLYSRTRDLMDDFARAFGNADEVIVAPIYAAREEPLRGITADTLAARITEEGTPACAAASRDAAAAMLKVFDISNTILITMGAGDIYQVAEQLVE